MTPQRALVIQGKFRPAIRFPRTAAPAAMFARQVAQAYNYPLHVDGTGYIGAIIELGGGYRKEQITAAFNAQGVPVPTFVDVFVAGGSNSPDGPSGADGEVQLDMIVAGAIAPGATFRIYFTTNTDDGYLAAVQQAIADGCHGISTSWGGPEDSWGKPQQVAFETALKQARSQGIPFFAAAGDTGADDGEGHPVVDFPACAPSAIGCGGTRLELDPDGTRASETVWDDNSRRSATGGGISKRFPGRDVPDVAGNADPESGYELMVDGQSTVVGGTSAVAPLMLGLHALLWQLNGARSGKPFDLMNTIATNPQVCFDVTSGSNGAFRAGPGRDEVTGFGVVDGTKIEDVILSLTPNPTPPPSPLPPAPTPTPTPTPPPLPPTPTPGPNPLADFPAAAVRAWGATRHTHTAAENNAYRSLQNWAAEYGITI